MKTTNTKSFYDIKAECDARVEEFANEPHRRWIDPPPHIYDNVEKEVSCDKCCREWEDIMGRLSEMTAYYRTFGHDEFKKIIKYGYNNVSPKMGDTVIYYHGGKYHIGFVNELKTTIESSAMRKSKEYMSVYISYMCEDGTSYSENFLTHASKESINVKLIDRNMTFGRPLNECHDEFLKKVAEIEQEEKRRSKRKIMTVGEYEDLMSLVRRMAEDIHDINNKVPSNRHLTGPM